MLAISKTKAAPGSANEFVCLTPSALSVRAACVMATSAEVEGGFAEAKLANCPVADVHAAAAVVKAEEVPKELLVAPVHTDHPAGKPDPIELKFCV